MIYVLWFNVAKQKIESSKELPIVFVGGFFKRPILKGYLLENPIPYKVNRK